LNKAIKFIIKVTVIKINCALIKPPLALFKSFNTLPECVDTFPGKYADTFVGSVFQPLLLKTLANNINTSPVAALRIHETNAGKDVKKFCKNVVTVLDNSLLASCMLRVIVVCLSASSALNFEAMPS